MNPETPEDETRVDEAELIKKLEAELGEPSPLNASMPTRRTLPVPPAQPEVTVGLDPRPALAAVRTKRNYLKAGILILVSVLILVGTSAAILTRQSRHNPLSKIFNQSISRTYDSPIGLLPPFQKQAIGSGKFKLTSSYATGEPTTRQGTFHVSQDGQISFDMLPDADIVNELISFLYTKGGNIKAAPAGVLADRNFRYDFQSVLGYHYLYDHNAPLGGDFIAKVETNKTQSQDKKDKTITNGPKCEAAVNNLKKQTTVTSLNTVDLSPSTSKQGSKTAVTIDPQRLQQTDKSVLAFFDSCFDLPAHGLVEYAEFVRQLKAHPTKAPTITYWQDAKDKSLWHLVIADVYHQQLTFDIWGLSQTATKPSGTIGSYRQVNNTFGLAYSACRVVPVAYSDFAASYSYHFVAEDTLYDPPSELETGYVCTTDKVNSGYDRSDFMTINYKQTGDIQINSTKIIDLLVVVHDLAYYIEQYNLEHHSYPSSDQVNGLVSKLGDLSAAANQALQDKTIVYSLTPDGCTTKCTGYLLQYELSKNNGLNFTLDLNKSEYGHLHLMR